MRPKRICCDCWTCYTGENESHFRVIWALFGDAHSRVVRHYAACSLSLRVTRSFDAVRMLTSACIAAITDCVLRTKASDIPSWLSLHYSGQAEGPINAFGFDAGYFRLESDNAKLPDPHLQVRMQDLPVFSGQSESFPYPFRSSALNASTTSRNYETLSVTRTSSSDLRLPWSLAWEKRLC
jgi:hypothetical protein